MNGWQHRVADMRVLIVQNACQFVAMTLEGDVQKLDVWNAQWRIAWLGRIYSLQPAQCIGLFLVPLDQGGNGRCVQWSDERRKGSNMG